MATTYTYKEVKALIKKISGQEHIITTPRVFIEMTGDHLVALFLGQAIYWSDKTTDPDGWFYHTDEEWHEELAISRYQVKRCCEVLADYGLKTKIKKVKGAPRTHYYIDFDIFIPKLMAHLDMQETCISRNSQMDMQETHRSDMQETHRSLKEQRISKTTTTTRQRKPTQPATPNTPNGVGGGGPLLNEKPTETEIYLRSIGCKSKTAIARHKDKPVDGVKAEYNLLIASGKRYDDPGAVLISILDAVDWVAPSPSSAPPLPERPQYPCFLPEWQTWDTTTQQEEMQKYQIADRKWKAAQGGRA